MTTNETGVRRHRDTRLDPPSTPSFGAPWLSVVLWSERVFVVATVVVAVITGVTRDQWMAEGFTDDRFPVSWLPNVCLVMVLAAGIGSTWLSGLGSTPNSAWRDGDTLVAPTTLGLRRIDLGGALAIRFRLFTQSGTVHGVLLVDRRFRLLLLLPAFFGGGRRLARLTGRPSAGGFWRAALEYLLGFGWLVGIVVFVFLLGSFAGWASGAMIVP